MQVRGRSIIAFSINGTTLSPPAERRRAQYDGLRIQRPSCRCARHSQSIAPPADVHNARLWSTESLHVRIEPSRKAAGNRRSAGAGILGFSEQKRIVQSGQSQLVPRCDHSVLDGQAKHREIRDVFCQDDCICR